jgi:hypothetical protein
MGVVKEFKEFAVKGNVVDLAVGVIIGAAFGKIVTSLVQDLIMPPIGKLTGGLNFTSMFYDMSGGNYPSLEAAKAAGAATINYGAFILRDLPGDQADQQAQGAAAPRRHPRVPALPDQDPQEGQALRRLHLGSLARNVALLRD